jgi:adenylate cyclase
MKLIFSTLTLDLERLCLLGPAGQIRLRPKSFEVLRHLAEHAGQTVTKDELIAAIWPDVTVSEESLTRCISDIRLAVGDHAQRIIKTLPKRGYLLEGPVSRDGNAGGASPRPADLPSIAVLAFVNLSRDPNQEYFSEGITEDIITELSRFSELLVIARNSSFQYKGRSVDVRQIGSELDARYILEGSIQSSDGTVRITAQLIDAARGTHLWADRFDRKLGDTFSIQDEIARMISARLAMHIDDAEAHRPLAKPTASWEAYDYFLRGNHMLNRLLTGVPVGELYKARKLLERSIEMDPAFARPYAALATSYSVAWINPVNQEYQTKETLQRVFELAQKAVELGPNEAFGHKVLANAAMFRRDGAACLAAWHRVFELNPNYCDWRYGQCLVLLGQPEEGLAAIRRHMRLDPFFPPHALMVEGLGHLVQRRYQQALPPFREMMARAPDFRNGRLMLAATYAHMEEADEARRQVKELLRVEPDCSLKKLSRQHYFHSAEHGLHMLEGLRKAGVPEG